MILAAIVKVTHQGCLNRIGIYGESQHAVVLLVH
jgi:hypothetical protein